MANVRFMRVQWQCKFWLATYLAGVLHKNTAAAASVTEPVTRQPTHCSDLGVSAAGIGRHHTSPEKSYTSTFLTNNQNIFP